VNTLSLPKLLKISVNLKYGDRDITESCIVFLHSKDEGAGGEPQLSSFHKPSLLNYLFER
jgi:hypothetical protein